MVVDRALLDTDILSAIMRGNSIAISKAEYYLKIHGRFTISIITRYEILRGLKAKHATSQLASFDRLCASSSILQLTDEIIVKAADIYALLRRKGAIISDADILIGATALVNGFVMVTNNEEHFKRISGLRVENWLKP